jgi:hypothetical protein
MLKEGKEMYTLITGATSGIGKTFALMLGQKRKNLILIGRNEKELKKLTHMLTKKHDMQVIPIQMDLTDTRRIHQLEAFLKEEQIELEMVINNAGMGSYGHFENLPHKEHADLIDVNIRAFTLLSKSVLPFMKRGSTLLQVASVAAFAPGPYMATYYASKAYVLSFSLALQEEIKHKGIHVSILCPGPTKTAFFERAHMEKASFTKYFMQEVEDVVAYAYKQVLKRKTIIVPGTVNKIMVAGLRYLPHQVGARLVGFTQGEK